MASKPLPHPIRNDKLPPPPPSDHDNLSSFVPPPPPKIVQDLEPQYSYSTHPPIPPINTSLSPNSLDSGLHVPPLTPMTPIGSTHSSAPPSPQPDGRPKKVNPLTDLVETERSYVDLLTGIIRKVAAAWSRSNLPPPELDTMFRSVEGVYRANRALLAKLKELGTNPSSPKALGDLLMRWIDDLETPYTNYTLSYSCGFDSWDPVQSNPRLRTTLAVYSASNPPPLPPNSVPHPSAPPLWTLDALFLLPKDRLKYYKKLYGRLLKSTTPGRSDHRLLTVALDKLDGLLSTLDQRATMRVGGNFEQPPPPVTEDEVVIDMRTRDSTGVPPKNAFPGPPSNRESDSTGGTSSNSSGGRLSQDTAPTSDGRGSSSTMTMPVIELERRLSTERTLDIFTMKPKQVRLQISPPTLHYTRELRISADAVLNLIPRSTGVEVVEERGHLFLLTDLLLICARMTREEIARFGPDGPDMWLLYPPLAGKHLRVAPVDGSDTALIVTILRKETLTVTTSSPQLRNKLVHEFRECIDTGASLVSSKNQAPPPPVPAIPNGLPGSPSVPLERNPNGPRGPRSSGSVSPPTRAFSPSRGMGGPQAYPTDQQLANGMSRMGLAPDPRIPPMGNAMPGPMFPPRSSSSALGPPGAPNGPGPTFNPGQGMPGPTRGVPPSGPFGPGQVMPPSHYGLPPGAMMPVQPGQGPQMEPPNQPGPGQVVPPARNTSYRGPGEPPRGPQMGLPQRPGQPGGHPNGPPMGPPGNPQGNGYGQLPNMASPPSSRPPSGSSSAGGLRNAPSGRSLNAQADPMHPQGGPPPMPAYPDELQPPRPHFLPRSDSSSSLNSLSTVNSLQAPRPLLPSAQLSLRTVSVAGSFIEPSPPNSPVDETPKHSGPVTSSVTAQMKCKVFLKQHHAQWKNIGSAKLKLYHESPTNVKQLVVESDNSKKTVIISTIVLEDGVERVGRTGVAVELSDKGSRTGIVYMIQLRNETSAGGLFDSLLAGSDRSVVGAKG